MTDEQKQTNEVVIILDALNKKGLKDRHIANKINASPSRIVDWRDGTNNPQPEFLQKLKALMNIRVADKPADITTVAKGLRLKLSEDWKETFLTKALSKALAERSNSMPEKAKIESIQTIDDLNKWLVLSRENFLENQVDKHLNFQQSHPYDFQFNSFSADDWYALPSGYQKKAVHLIESIEAEIERAEEYIGKKQKEQKNEEDMMRRSCEYTMRTLISRHHLMHLDEGQDIQELLAKFNNEIQEACDHYYDGKKYEGIPSYQYKSLAKEMEYAGKFLCDSKYMGRLGTFDKEHSIALYGDDIYTEQATISMDDFIRIVATAKELVSRLKEFAKYQHGLYQEMKGSVLKTYSLCSGIALEQCFNLAMCKKLEQGEMLSVQEPLSNSQIADQILRRNIKKLSVVISNEVQEIDLAELLTDWFNEHVQEVVFKQVQVLGDLIYTSNDENPLFKLYRTGNDQLVVVRSINIQNKDYPIVEQNLSAFEVVEQLNGSPYQDDVKQALLEDGYALLDVETIA